MKLVAVLTLTFLMFSFQKDEITTANIPDGGFGIQVDGVLQLPTAVKAKVKAGGAVGNSSKITVSDTTHIVELSKDAKLVFYARVYEGNKTCPLSIIKVEKTEKGYEAESNFGELVKEPIMITAIPFYQKPVAGVKNCYSVTPNAQIPPGIYALNFHNAFNKKIEVSMDNIGNSTVLFRVK